MHPLDERLQRSRREGEISTKAVQCAMESVALRRSWHARWMIALSRLGAQLLSHRNELEAAGHNVARIEDAYNGSKSLSAMYMLERRMLN